MGFADGFDVGCERKRRKSQDVSKLFGLRTQKHEVLRPEYLPASSYFLEFSA